MKQLTPKISVIIPVFNTEKYLDEAVGSILKQSLKEIEIIAVDDGSTDSSHTILDKIARSDSRVTVISQKNQGQSVARNRGISIASGKYIYFMDSDDILHENALEECFDKCEKESLDMVMFDGESFSDEKNFKPIFEYKRLSEMEDKVYTGLYIFSSMVEKRTFSPSPCLYMTRLSIIKENFLTFYPEIIHEDNLFTPLLCLHCERVGIIPIRYFKRRIRSNSTMTSKISWKNIHGYLTVTSEILRQIGEYSPEEGEALKSYISSMMSAVCFKARKLPLKERIRYITIIIKNYLKYVPVAELAKVIVPKR